MEVVVLAALILGVTRLAQTLQNLRLHLGLGLFHLLSRRWVEQVGIPSTPIVFKRLSRPVDSQELLLGRVHSIERVAHFIGGRRKPEFVLLLFFRREDTANLGFTLLPQDANPG